jgi:uncharacterized protein (DUF2336 family)
MSTPANNVVPLPAPSRAEVLDILESHKEQAQLQLARHTGSEPEVLYYLAKEGDAKTRCAVAANPATPPHANRFLADDAEEDVRAELARKIGRLLPDLTSTENKRLTELTLDTLERLARDQLPRVRRILAEEIKSLDCVPQYVVDALARDLDTTVAAPIIEYSPLLSDTDLIEIVACAQASEAISAVARRRPVSAAVSDAVVSSLDVGAVAALLANRDARVRKDTLDKIVDSAKTIEAWHVPLVMRVDISQRVIRRLAGFVGAALIERLAGRRGLDERTQKKLKQELRKRVEAGEDAETEDPLLKAHNEVTLAQKQGRLDEAFVEAAAEEGKREAVIAALAALSKVPQALVRRIVQSNSPKPVVALCWRAGLAMRAAFKIQTFILKLPAQERLPARGGVDFPLTEDEMRWHLDYFGIAG